MILSSLSYVWKYKKYILKKRPFKCPLNFSTMLVSFFLFFVSCHQIRYQVVGMKKLGIKTKKNYF